MAHGRKKSEKSQSMGSRGSKSRGPQMTKKQPGFGAKLGKMRPGKGPEGPHMGMKGAI